MSKCYRYHCCCVSVIHPQPSAPNTSMHMRAGGSAQEPLSFITEKDRSVIPEVLKRTFLKVQYVILKDIPRVW